jgi:HD-like signal output (HDOD) protein
LLLGVIAPEPLPSALLPAEPEPEPSGSLASVEPLDPEEDDADDLTAVSVDPLGADADIESSRSASASALRRPITDEVTAPHRLSPPEPIPWWRRLWALLTGQPAAALPIAPAAPVQVVGPRRGTRGAVIGPAPWEGAESLVSSDLGRTRALLLERLYGLREVAPGKADWWFTDRLIREIGNPRLDFPLFPEGALKLDRLLRGGEPPRGKVAELVRQEPGLVQRVWQEAHTAAYGAQRPLTLDEALVRIGQRRLWQLAMSACMSSPVFRVRGYQDRANHLRGVSIVASEVSRVFDPSGDTYLPSLLHGLGKLVVYRCGPAREPERTGSAVFVAAVAELVYPSVGVLVAEAWDLGPSVAAGIGYSPTPDRAPAAYKDVTLATRAASVAAHEGWAERKGQTYDGFRTLTGMGYSPGQVGRALDTAQAAWRRLPTGSSEA